MACPENGGTAIGSGPYHCGEFANLSATANENYQFVGWTNQDGDTISTDPEYAHMVARGGQITAHFVNTVSLDEAEEIAITVYPNPSGNTLNIRTALQNSCVEVYDLTGKLVCNQEITENIASINAESWPSGVYVWKVYTTGVSTGSTTLAETGKWVKE